MNRAHAFLDRSFVSAANDVAGSARDPRIARALVAVSARPADPWTVNKLAKVAGLSRAAFARRFVAEIGVPPLGYVALIRMVRAAELLVRRDDSLARIAAEVGYRTEFALSRAFRRIMGEPPTVYRKRARGAGQATMALRAA